jgi:hypothetical protein
MMITDPDMDPLVFINHLLWNDPIKRLALPEL